MEYICIVLVLVGTFSKSYQILVYIDAKGLKGRVSSPLFETFLPYEPYEYEQLVVDSKDKCTSKCDELKIELFVDHFKLEDTPKCDADYLQIIATCQGKPVNAGKYCGLDIPAKFTMYRCQKVAFRFCTSPVRNFDGYFITYQISPGPPPPWDKPYDIQKSTSRPANVYKDIFAFQDWRYGPEGVPPEDDQASDAQPSYANAVCIVMAVTFIINWL